MIKVVIVFLLIAMIISLTGGAVFFFKDQGSTKRTLHALGVRLTIAVLLIITILYGVFTGKLGLNAPWHQQQRPLQQSSQPVSP
jgi:uncharacterized membrane protein